jgi:LacI family transcriptional regulator
VKNDGADGVRRPVTIRAVAERAGVSPSVVSFVLNKSQPVSAEKRVRVLSAVAELGYEPSRAARSLRMNRTGTAGVLIPYLVNPTQAAMAVAIEQALAERDYLAVICATGGREARERSYFRMLRATRVDGLLVYPTGDMRADLEDAIAYGTPVIHLFRELPLTGRGADAVVVDNVSIVEHATARLLALGHRRVALVTLPLDSLSGPDRIEGYRRAHRAAGIEVDDSLVLAGEGTTEGGYTLAVAALSRRPTALVVTTSPQMVGAVQAVQAAGLSVPSELSIVGSNPHVPLMHGVALTIWDYPTAAVGRRAVELLMERLASGPEPAPRRIVLRPELQDGGSIAPPP